MNSLFKSIQTSFSKLDLTLLGLVSGICDYDFPLINLKMKTTLKDLEQKLESLKPKERKTLLIKLNILVDSLMFLLFSPIVGILVTIMMFQMTSIFQVHLELKLRVKERLENYYLYREPVETNVNWPQGTTYSKNNNCKNDDVVSDQDDDCWSESTATSGNFMEKSGSYLNQRKTSF